MQPPVLEYFAAPYHTAVRIPDEIELWQKLTEGDAAGFRDLFNLFWEPLFQYAYKILKSRQDAEEQVQELFIHIWQKKDSLPQVASVAAYLTTALKNRLLNQLSRKPLVTIPVEQIARNGDILQTYQSSSSENNSDNRLLHSLSMHLPEKMRYVYIRHQLEGCSIREIACDTGNSEQTIRNQLANAIKKMSLMYREQLIVALLLLLLNIC